MPLVSKSQARELFAIKPAMAKEWAAMTPNIASLPEHVKTAATKRLRRQTLNRGEAFRRFAARNTNHSHTAEKGGPIPFQPGSYKTQPTLRGKNNGK